MHINKEVATFVEEKVGKVIGHNNIYLKNKSLCRRYGIHLSDKASDILKEDLNECLGRIYNFFYNCFYNDFNCKSKILICAI